tara:strand:- start:2259 stop:2498 length:240 start_codon:yes stop_codon:yes gene_type:complete
MGKVITLFEKPPKCVVCQRDSERLVFTVDVCHDHAVSVASFMIETQRAMKNGQMDWAAICRVVEHVATVGLRAPTKELN